MREFLPEGTASVDFLYPRGFAVYVQETWPAVVDEHLRALQDGGVTDSLPSPALLRKFISTAYQASLHLDEGRQVNFRLMLRSPDRLDRDTGPPDALHPLVFQQPRPFTPHDLKQLSSIAEFHRSLIGVEFDPDDGFRIWGVISSGSRWAQEQYGGRRPTCPLPASPVLHVTAPGTMQFNAGSMVVGRLEGGRVLGKPMNVYDSAWLPQLFLQELAEIVELHEQGRQRALQEGRMWGCLDNQVIRQIIQQMVKRLVATIRDSRHGGLLVIVSPEDADAIERSQHGNGVPPIRMKYLFSDGAARGRFRSLLLLLLANLAEAHPECAEGREKKVGWKEFQTSMMQEPGTFDEGILEIAHLAAGLASADGAVLMNKRFDIIGFGGEISPELPLAPAVAQALDVEATQTRMVATDLVGTRHRAAYRLVSQLRDCIAIVVSQDQEVRFVAWQNDSVTYWRQ